MEICLDAMIAALFGLVAGYGINRLAMRFVERYTGFGRTYGGLMRNNFV